MFDQKWTVLCPKYETFGRFIIWSVVTCGFQADPTPAISNDDIDHDRMSQEYWRVFVMLHDDVIHWKVVIRSYKQRIDFVYDHSGHIGVRAWGWGGCSPWSRDETNFRSIDKFFRQELSAKNEKNQYFSVINRQNGMHSVHRYEVPEIPFY